MSEKKQNIFPSVGQAFGMAFILVAAVISCCFTAKVSNDLDTSTIAYEFYD